MAKNFNEQLIELLKTDSRFVDDEGELVRAAVIDRAWKIDRELVKLLLSKPENKAKFFGEIEGHWIFNINTFIEYIADKNFLANSYTRFRNKIGLNIDGKFLRQWGEVSLVWPYKDCVLEGGQTKEEEKRKEIFFNEILAQDEIDRLFDSKVLTNWKRYTVDGEQKVTEIKRDENGTIKENLIIKGNNLLTLHSLKKIFRGKVKVIYIDPPFNTGNDEFGYNDSFNHSTWLTFMKNRLEIGKAFLQMEGVIFIHHDDKEFSYLRALCDEIFGRENFLNNIVVKTSDPSGHKTVNPSPYSQTEYILMYANSKQNYKYDMSYVPSEYDPGYNQYIENISSECSEWVIRPLREKVAIENGFDSVRDASKKKGKYAFNEMVAEFALNNRDSVFQPTAISNDAGSEIVRLRDISKNESDKIFCYKRPGYDDVFIKNGRQIYFYASKVKEIDGEMTPAKPLTNLWVDIPYNGISSEGGVKLKNGKKPEKLLRRIIEISTTRKDIVMDFHLGSGTTTAVAHKMGRQYIGIEQLDYGENDSVTRLKNVINGDQSGISKVVNWRGGGDFIYSELMKYNEAYMDEIQAAKTSEELVELWKDIAENSFLNWYINPEMPEEAINDFIEIGKSENGLEKQKKLMAELLNKNQLYVNLTEIDDADFNVTEEDKKLNQSFYGGNA
ncbi:site-specific DNA-methyltransferase [Candidatus Parcubacteria bacterium]|nr:MAG: site-specific DNA-methyltransferase [Candidatus Parcubacteria bacterium]